MNYFKPFRRKLGVITLVMACTLATGWIRSCHVLDRAFIPITSRSTVEFSSMRSKFSLVQFSRSSRFEWRSSPIEDADDHLMNLYTAEWSTRFGGVRLFSNLHAWTDKSIGLVLPYWMLVAPLTLLSAWLLLSKPHSRRPVPHG